MTMQGRCHLGGAQAVSVSARFTVSGLTVSIVYEVGQ